MNIIDVFFCLANIPLIMFFWAFIVSFREEREGVYEVFAGIIISYIFIETLFLIIGYKNLLF